jgi:hypothetical protein
MKEIPKETLKIAPDHPTKPFVLERVRGSLTRGLLSRFRPPSINL